MKAARSSSVARIEQASTAFLVACALGWLVFEWPSSPWKALAGFTVIAFGYSVFLGVEFILLRFAGKGDPAPQPTWGELARAWAGETLVAPLVFCWRQPFRWNAVPDHLDEESGLQGRRGAVFIHGFMCNRGLWTPWMHRLKGRGHAFVAVNLEPAFGSIDGYAEQVDAAVQAVTAATGMPPVLICHSMGGLAARAWLRSTNAPQRVHHVVTIGTPHGGTWLGRFSHLRNGVQMRLGSAWLRQLVRDEATSRLPPFTCWYSNCDNIVFPASTATLAGADNQLARGAAHVQLAFDARVTSSTLSLLAPL